MCNPFDLWQTFQARWGETIGAILSLLGITLPEWFPLQWW